MLFNYFMGIPYVYNILTVILTHATNDLQILIVPCLTCTVHARWPQSFIHLHHQNFSLCHQILLYFQPIFCHFYLFQKLIVIIFSTFAAFIYIYSRFFLSLLLLFLIKNACPFAPKCISYPHSCKDLTNGLWPWLRSPKSNHQCFQM